MYYQLPPCHLKSAMDATLRSPLIICRGAFSPPVILSLLCVIFLVLVSFLQRGQLQHKRRHTVAELTKRFWPTYSLRRAVADPWAWDYEAVEESSCRKKKKRKYHRRTSHMSAIAANRDLLEKGLAVEQNVINIICFVDCNMSKDDMRLDFIEMMTTLAAKYERMRSIPRFDVDERIGECVWCPIERNFVDECVSVDPMYDEYGEDVNTDTEKLVLQRAHSYASQILAPRDESGQDMPLWRVVILSSKAVLLRVDHCICDGVSAVTLLRDIGVKTDSKGKIALEDLSPILRYFVRAGELRIRMLPLKLVCWPPNLIRAVKFLVNCLTLPYEVPNPLRPLPEHFGKPIPSDSM